MSWGYSRPCAELERAQPDIDDGPPPFERLGTCLIWVGCIVSREIGKAVYGLGTPREPLTKPAGVSRARYVAMVTAEAHRNKLDPRLCLGRSHKAAHARARMAVWRQLRDEGCSLPAIGRVAERDHSTILIGLRRLDEIRHGKKPVLKPRVVVMPLPMSTAGVLTGSAESVG